MDIQIISDQRENLSPGYQLTHLVNRWRESGHQVLVGPASVLQADIGIVHFDITKVAPTLIPANPDGRPLVNGGVLDIGKRRVSSGMVDSNSKYDGPVIIKTDANSFGGPERAALPAWSLMRMRRRLVRWIGWRLARDLPKLTYPILPSIKEVPTWVWNRSDLIVERFQPEREGDLYVVRTWNFLGDCAYGMRSVSPSPIVKRNSRIRYEFIDETYEELWDLRRKWGMDYGRFDYVLVDGRPVVFDINKTPTTRTDPRVLDRLVPGIDACLAGTAAVPLPNSAPGKV